MVRSGRLIFSSPNSAMATKRGGGGSNGHGAGGKSSAKGGIGSASRGGDSSSAVGSGTRVQIDKNKVC